VKLATRILLGIVLSTGFTLVIIQYSLRHGRLILPPTYDDVTYFADGLARLEVLYRDRLPGLVADHFRNPPHSPFASYLALVSFALFGVHDWAPYAGNVILVFALLAFVDHLLRGQAWWLRLAAALFTLTVPFAGEAVAEFRPDIACGLLTAMGVVLILERPFLTIPVPQRRLAGACFGLALLFKPTIFPITLVLLALSLAIASYSDRARLPPPRTIHGVWTSWAPVLWPFALLGLPQFLLMGRYYFSYFSAALLASSKPIPDFQGTVAEKLAFYTLGDGGRTMLGWHLYLLAAVVVLGGVLLVAWRRMDSLRPLLNQLVPGAVAYAIPTLSPVKQYFFGVTFAILLFFLAIQAIRAVLEAQVGRSRTRWVAAGAADLVVIGILCSQPPPNWGEPSDASIQRRHQLPDQIFGAIRDARPHAHARIYVTTAGSVNAQLLQYMALANGFTGWSFGTFGWSEDLELYQREVNGADFVLASEPGNSEVYPHLMSAGLQERTLALVRSRPDFVQNGAFPTLNEKSYVLFEKIGPFFGWSATTGLLDVEGPYPQWELPLVRWGCGPSSVLTPRDQGGGRMKLIAKCRSSLAGQQMTIRLDGRELQRQSLDTGRFDQIEIPLTLAPGPHRVKLDYTVWERSANAPPRAVLFEVLQVVPDR